MEKKKYIVYYNDKVNEVAEVFSAETLDACKDWINNQLEGMIPVNDEYPCTDDVMFSSNTFFFEVFDRPIVDTNGSEYEPDCIYNDSVYSSDYYYVDKI